MFDRLWNDKAHVEDVKKEVLEELKRLGMNQNPQFIYYKTLFHLFKDFIDDQAQQGLLAEPTQLIDTEIWKKLYEFQKHGVKGAINKILTYNGCIIADSVGLGKTFEALAVIKYFEMRNKQRLGVVSLRSCRTTGQFIRQTITANRICFSKTVSTTRFCPIRISVMTEENEALLGWKLLTGGIMIWSSLMNHITSEITRPTNETKQVN